MPIKSPFHQDDVFQSSHFKDLREIECDLTGKSFEDCTFESCDFTGSDFSESLFLNCTFIQCNLSLVSLGNAKLQTVHFDRCKIMGVDFTLVNRLILQIAFHECLIKDCIYSELSLSETEFRKCEVLSSDFFGTDLFKSDFSESNLKDTIFESTNLKEANFINACHYRIHPLTNKVKHARFSMPEAMILLQALDIEIQD